MKLINKDALVAEIEKIYNEDYKFLPSDIVADVQDFKDDILRSIDTLEVKEVDLEEKATQLSQKYFPDEENIWARPNIEAHKCKSACIEMVEWLKEQKHFSVFIML